MNPLELNDSQLIICFNEKFGTLVQFVRSFCDDPDILAKMGVFSKYYSGKSPFLINHVRDIVVKNNVIYNNIKKLNYAYNSKFYGTAKVIQND